MVVRFVVCCLLISSFVLAADTEVRYLSGTDKDHTVPWDFYCTTGPNSGQWTRIPVPSNWELQGFGTYKYGRDEPGVDEKGLYRHRFEAPVEWRSKKVFIVFEGVLTDAEVLINGRSAGPIHQGGFYRFKYDISRMLDFGQPNILQVNVSEKSSEPTVNDAERTSDYWVFGGIYRPVYLEIYPTEFIQRTAINAKADGAFAINVYLQNISAANNVTAQIRTLDGLPIGQPFSQNVDAEETMVTLGTRVADPQTWTPETPSLYQVEIRLRRGATTIHQVRERFGFRTVELRPEDGIYVNGRKVILKGTNRHSFWPDSGRTTSPEISSMDVNLIKDMNMNAVRMSHYPPDKHFLETCDSLGLFVLDELGGWQKKYGTEIGKKLVEELVTRDVNHPSIIIWDNGNEGGWNRELDGEFAKWDPQKRHVIHPWEDFNFTNTAHYRPYGCCPETFFNGKDVFFPTEFLHGLYDGGLGAGLEDYWNLIISKPVGAGGFLWAMIDEGVKRTDRDGAIDTAGNQAPDGLLGPYREKEGSFFAVKEIWSPVVVPLDSLPKDFAGRVPLENRYDFTSLDRCRFSWRLVKFRSPWDMMPGYTVASEGEARAPVILPGEKGEINLGLPGDWRRQDALLLTARDPFGREIYTWSWTIQDPGTIRDTIVRPVTGRVNIAEDEKTVTARSGANSFAINKQTGMLDRVEGFSFTGGPSLAIGESSLTGLRHYPAGTDQVVEATYSGNMRSVKWRFNASGWVRLDYEYQAEGDFDFLGVSFNYPEKNVTSMKWLGKGPYRVWKNRLKGATHNVWTKFYNDTKTGASWVYPEFKGYHDDFYWALLETTEGPITVVAESPDLYLRVFTPSNGTDPRFAAAPFPPGDISFLHAIAPIGTKFNKPENLGPQGAKNRASGIYKGSLYFYFGKLRSFS